MSMSELLRDLRFGLRLLAKSPVFAITAALLLAVGISANTLIFSLVDALLLRPLPVSHPENLVRLVEVHPNDFVTWDLPYTFCDRAAAGAALGELPAARAERYEDELGLSPASAWLLAFRGELGDYFEQTLAAAGIEHAQQVANWLAQLVARTGEQNPSESKVTAPALAQLVRMVAAREVSGAAAREALDALVEGGGDPREIIAARGLGALGADDGGLAELVASAIADDRDAAEQVRSGNQKAIGALIGAVMRETRGRADGAEVARLIHEQLGL